MTYKVIRNAQGEATCFGPNEDFYQPTVKAGEVLSIEAEMPPPNPPTYQELRASAYPPATNYLDAIVKGDTAQAQAYIDECLAVKAKYPK
jgi:hypothetical protein